MIQGSKVKKGYISYNVNLLLLPRALFNFNQTWSEACAHDWMQKLSHGLGSKVRERLQFTTRSYQILLSYCVGRLLHVTHCSGVKGQKGHILRRQISKLMVSTSCPGINIQKYPQLPLRPTYS